MEICIIHGSNRKGNTDKTIDLVKEQMDSFEEIVYSDIYLPRDLPHFCEGCFACLATGSYGGQNCPHKQYTHPIMEKLRRCDGIIAASPCYALAETAQIKALFDHFACNYICHRPYEEMYDKVAIVVSTAAGAGTGRVVSTISRNLLFWGVKRIIKCRINIWEVNWADMAEKRRLKAEELLRRKAVRFYKLTKNRHALRSGLDRKALRFIFKRLIKSYPDTNMDKIYWKSKGWI